MHVSELVESKLASLEASPRWNIRLLGRFQLTDGQRVHTRLPSRAVVALLARLALWPQRDHAREELAELLWPGAPAGVGRRRLRHTLSLLKDVLEPAENGPAPVLQADRYTVRVVGGALRCDVQLFEGLVRSHQPAAALAHYSGDLLPGFYEDWILDERQRLANLHEKLVGGSAPTRQPTSTPHTAAAEGAAVVGSSAAVVGSSAAAVGPGAAAVGPGGAREAGREAAPEGGSPAGPAAHRTAAGLQRTDRSTLPVFLTRYLGDDAQLARLAACTRRFRWLTLIGPGGGGKTRLAVELAHRLHAGHLPQGPQETGAGARPAMAAEEPNGVAGDGTQFDRVVFVALVGIEQREGVLGALAKALRIDTSNPSFDGLVARLAGWRTLLILDNVEQLAGVADELWLQLTAALPSVHLLLTSRRSFGGAGEQLFFVAPLGLPTAKASVQAVASSAAVALFVDRAAAVRADFHVSPRNHEVLAALAVALEGMPLAIELAASRLRSVTPAEMLKRLRAGPAAPGDTPALDLLARPSPRSAGDPRHASMLRTIEWSWRQLDAPQRALAGAMTVFSGGCSLEMLQHVSSGGARVAYVLDELLSHSLALSSSATNADAADDDTPLFRLYEPVREFAALQFDAAQTADWRARHRAWAIAWARALPATPALPEVRAQLPNIAAALQSAAADAAGEDAVLLLLALNHSLEDVELPLAALRQASAAVDACRDATLRSRGHTAIGPLLHAAGAKDEARRHVEAALDDAPADPALRVRALYALARVRWRNDMQHPERVLPTILEAQALAEGAGDAYVEAGLLSLRAFVTEAQDGAPEAALRLQRQALERWRTWGNRHAQNLGRYNVAVYEYQTGNVDRAIAEFDAIATEARVLQDWRRLAVASDARGTVLSALRRWPEALQAHREALDLAWQSMSIYTLAYAFWNLPPTLAHLRRPEQALQLMAFAEVFWVERIGVLTRADGRDLLRVRRLAARQLNARACAEAWIRGRLLSLAEAMALATDA